MAKRNWPDHVAVGMSIRVDNVPHLIVDAKAGPMFVNTADFDKPSAEIHGTIILRVKPLNGTGERWLPPTDGAKLVAWAERERRIAAAPKLAGEKE